MSEKILEVENLSKLYQLGNIGTGTISHDLNRWWYKMRGKMDPYEMAATSNVKTSGKTDGFVWSLKDINFSINRGDVFGVVGSNGAGKSTLLKILSKITKPTKGVIRLNGKVASLLEVGTGFHPELTGRENIYLNGAILGMRKKDITAKFEEIVEFSGISRYLDTPVKRYSSGMFVRLAFSVGAHLEPDILIIDEVLAVGDADFQAKCLGKMKDVSVHQGRTVLFVSHNLSAIKQLCNKGILLENGMQLLSGDINEVLSVYQSKDLDAGDGQRGNIPDQLSAYFTKWDIKSGLSNRPFTCSVNEECTIRLHLHTKEMIDNVEVRLAIKYEGFLIVNISSLANGGPKIVLNKGDHHFLYSMKLPLRSGQFTILATLVRYGKEIDSWQSSTALNIMDDFSSELYPGIVIPEFAFHHEAYQVITLNKTTA